MTSKKVQGFTLVELLVVVAIIGILTSLILVSLGRARQKSKEAAIIQNLKNIQTSAIVYKAGTGTFEGLCNYSDGSFDSTIKENFQKLENIAGENNVSCIVRTEDVPATSHFFAGDNLARKNFGVAVFFAGEYYAVDTLGILLIDKESKGTSNWNTAVQTCMNEDKELISIEILKAMIITGARNKISIGSTHIWSSTESSNDRYSYRQSTSGSMTRYARHTLNRIYCASRSI